MSHGPDGAHCAGDQGSNDHAPGVSSVARKGGIPAPRGAERRRRHERRPDVHLPEHFLAPGVPVEAASVFVLVKDLARRPQGATMGVAAMGAELGLSVAAVERGLTYAYRAGRIVSGKRGHGRTAVRRVVDLVAGERFARIPVALVGALGPRHVVLYGVLDRLTVQGKPTADADLAKATGWSEATVKRVRRELAAAGWLTVTRTGRTNTYSLNRSPLRPVPAPAEQPANGVTGEGSTGVTGEGSNRTPTVCSFMTGENHHPFVKTVREVEPTGAATNERQQQPTPETSKPARPVLRITEGVRLLVAFGRAMADGRLTLTGDPLAHQGLRVDGLLAVGWTPEQITEHLTRCHRSQGIRKTGSAAVSAWLGILVAADPQRAAGAPQQSGQPFAAIPGQRRTEPSSTRAAGRTVAQATMRRDRHGCTATAADGIECGGDASLVTRLCRAHSAPTETPEERAARLWAAENERILTVRPGAFESYTDPHDWSTWVPSDGERLVADGRGWVA